MESLSRCLLLALEAYEKRHAARPTVPELAADLGISPDFGHSYLVKLLEGEVQLGRVSHYGGHFQLTAAGREALDPDAMQAREPDPILEPTFPRS